MVVGMKFERDFKFSDSRNSTRPGALVSSVEGDLKTNCVEKREGLELTEGISNKASAVQSFGLGVHKDCWTC